MIKFKGCFKMIVVVSIIISSPILSQTKPKTHSKSFMIISVIKSIAGQKPTDEFFDFAIKADFRDWLFSMVSADIAISNIQTDSLGSTQSRMTEAGMMLNFVIPVSDKPDRQFFAGTILKIFNTIPYTGFVLGSVESRGQFLSSYFTLGILHILNGIDPIFEKSIGKNLFRNNIYIEFALHADSISILKNLRIKGGILIPAWGNNGQYPTNNDIETRITLEVPLGGVRQF